MPACRPDRTLIIALLADVLATTACSPKIYRVSGGVPGSADHDRTAEDRARRGGRAPDGLIRVRLDGGTLRVGGRQLACAPVAFSLTSGGTRGIRS